MLTPSRGRPEGLKRFIKSVKETTTECDMVFGFQDSDPERYDNILVAEPHGDWLELGNIGIINKLNALMEFAPGYDYYTIGSDDVVMMTKNWDQIVLNSAETLEKQLGHRHIVLYGDDGIHGQKLCTHPIISKEFIKTVGWFYPPGYMRHLYADNAIGLLAGNSNCLGYMDAVKLDHRHFIKDRSLMDDNYKETNSDEAYARDKKAYDEWVDKESPLLLEKLSNAIQ